MRARLAAAAILFALAAACHKDQTRGVDGKPEVPDSIDFGLVPVNGQRVLPLPVGNSGAIAVTLQDSHADEPFGVAALPDQPVQPGDQADVTVAFAPISPGAVSGTVVLTSDSIVAPQVSVAVHGIAYVADLSADPARIDFGDVNVGTASTKTFTITDQSPVPLQPEVEPTEITSDFNASPTGILAALDVGKSVNISVTFAPSTAGPQTSALSVGCASCALKQVQLTGNGIAITPPPPPPPPDAGTPDAGPVDAGTPDAGVPDAGPPDAGPPPECTLAATPGLVDFGTVAAAQSARQTVTYANPGTGTCFVQLPYLSPGTDPTLTVAGLAAFNLQPGDQKTFTAHFDPTAATGRLATGQLIAVSNDKVNSPSTVVLRGATLAPPPPPPPPGQLVVTPLQLTFTARAPAAPASQQVELRNTGGSDLTWKGTLDDAKVALGSTSGTLHAGDAVTVDVSVAGQANAEHRTSHATFDAGTAGKAVVVLDITFTAAPPPPPPPAQLAVTPLVLNFKAQVPAAPPTQSISISNTGGVALTWNGTSADANVSVTPATGTLNGGKSQFAAVAVAAQPFAETRTSTLVIDAGAAGKATVTLNIVFTEPPPPPPPPQYGTSVWPKWHHDNTNTGLSQIDTSKTTGAPFWKFKIGDPVGCIQDSRTGENKRCGTYVSSPVLDGDGNVVQLGGDGTVWLLDRDSGKKKWSTMTAPPWISGQEGTPTVVKDGSIFVMTAGESCTPGHPCTPQFFKLDGKTGDIKWKNTPGGDCGREACDGWDSCPAIDSDGTLYEADDDWGAIDVFDQSGTLLRKIQLTPHDDIETLGGALAPDGLGYWSANGRLWAVDSTKTLWSFSAPEIDPTADYPALAYSHNVKSGVAVTPGGVAVFAYARRNTKGDVYTRIWGFKAGRKKPTPWMTQLGPTTPRPGLPPGPGIPSDDDDALHYRSGITSPTVGPDGTVYIGHVDGLYALDGATGRFQWGLGMGSVVSSPAVGADGTIYVGSIDGNLYAVPPKGDRPRWTYKTGGQVNSSPAIGADGTIYFTSDDGYVYAVK